MAKKRKVKCQHREYVRIEVDSSKLRAFYKYEREWLRDVQDNTTDIGDSGWHELGRPRIWLTKRQELILARERNKK